VTLYLNAPLADGIPVQGKLAYNLLWQTSARRAGAGALS
jgi:hypothetical protein